MRARSQLSGAHRATTARPPGDPFRTDAHPVPGDWMTAQPRALSSLDRQRLAGRAILALSADLDPPESLRRLFSTGSGLPSTDLPIVTLDAPSDLTPTLVLPPGADAALVAESGRWLPGLERALAERPGMACVLSGTRIVSLREVIDAVRNAASDAAFEGPALPTLNDPHGPW